jgi:hypothetical protein
LLLAHRRTLVIRMLKMVELCDVNTLLYFCSFIFCCTVIKCNFCNFCSVVGNRVDFLFGGQSLPTFYTFLVYFERFLSENIPICVVFDGVKPQGKSITLTQRRKQLVNVTEDVLTKASMCDGGSRQLFTQRVMVEALLYLQQKYSSSFVIVHSALGEGDADVVRLARHLNAYAVVANDYDYIILLSTTPRIAYIPIDNIDFRGTEFRSFPAWEYQLAGAKGPKDAWIEFSKEDCLLLAAAAQEQKKDFAQQQGKHFASLSLGNVKYAAPDSKFGYSQFKMCSNAEGVVSLQDVRQPNILVLRYDVKDISLGLGLEESSLPAFATLVGCDFLPFQLLRGFHRDIGTMRRQGETHDVIPVVASLVRQHAEWSHLSAAAATGGSAFPFPFDEQFFSRAPPPPPAAPVTAAPVTSEVVSPAEMSNMARESILFFNLHRNRDELMLAAALLQTGLFRSFQSGLLDSRLVKCLVCNLDSISMPPAKELTNSRYNSRVNDNCYPLMAVAIKLLERLALANASRGCSASDDDNNNINLVVTTQQKVAAVLQAYNLESILTVTRPSSGGLEGDANLAAHAILDIMHQFYASCDMDASPILESILEGAHQEGAKVEVTEVCNC